MVLPRTVRVLLLEPDVWRFQGIARYLAENAAIEVLGEARAERALDAAARQHAPPPDAIVLAHKLIDDFGEEIIDRLRTANPSSPILIFGDSRCVQTIASFLARGASGYFLLSGAQHQLIDALRVVGKGDIWASRQAVLQSVRRNDRAPAPGRTSTDERLLLNLLCDGLANKEIASRLGVAEVTVKARLSRLYRRYGVTSRTQLIATLVRSTERLGA